MKYDPTYDPRSDDIQAQWEQDTPPENELSRIRRCLECDKLINSNYIYCTACKQLLTDLGLLDK